MQEKSSFSSYTDDDLIKNISKSDAFTELISRYSRVIVSETLLYSKKSVTGHDDLMQEALMAFYDAAKSFDKSKNTSFGTYASACIRNRLSNVIRDQRTNKSKSLDDFVELDDTTDFLSESVDSPESIYEKKEAFENVLNQIHISLSVFERKVLALYLSGYKRAETIKLMQISAKSYDNAMQRISTLR